MALVNPNYLSNVRMVVHLASWYGLRQVWFTDSRVSLTLASMTCLCPWVSRPLLAGGMLPNKDIALLITTQTVKIASLGRRGLPK